MRSQTSASVTRLRSRDTTQEDTNPSKCAIYKHFPSFQLFSFHLVFSLPSHLSFQSGSIIQERRCVAGFDSSAFVPGPRVLTMAGLAVEPVRGPWRATASRTSSRASSELSMRSSAHVRLNFVRFINKINKSCKLCKMRTWSIIHLDIYSGLLDCIIEMRPPECQNLFYQLNNPPRYFYVSWLV